MLFTLSVLLASFVYSSYGRTIALSKQIYVSVSKSVISQRCFTFSTQFMLRYPCVSSVIYITVIRVAIIVIKAEINIFSLL